VHAGVLPSPAPVACGDGLAKSACQITASRSSGGGGASGESRQVEGEAAAAVLPRLGGLDPQGAANLAGHAADHPHAQAPARRARKVEAAVYPVAVISELAARVTGKAPLATLDGIRMSRYRMFFSDAKARAELGYAARPYREGLRDAVAWFRQAGFVR
jgi:hypothetical protein